MDDILGGVQMIYSIPEDEAYAAVEFPFELIGSYAALQDIPHYEFKLERQVKQEIEAFREEEKLRKLHQEHQRRPAKDRNDTNRQPVHRATTSSATMQSTGSGNKLFGRKDYGPENTLSPTADTAEANRPKTRRFMSLFKSNKQRVGSK
ncbi:hypothetical protein GQ54DRAFT_188291 [Martensiomyces pterosporus]|nr:hypothetical protein GQ54DRAFT_188291 [Martensiomyces pterosporus]